MAAKICIIPECGEELSERSLLPTCANCRASINMWKRRGVRAVLERRARLKKYDSRMETLVDKRGSNVVVLSQRRKQA